MRPSDSCFETGDYEACMAAFAGGRDPGSSWALPMSYADVDSNPYVVGSQAYNIAHGLPAGPGWEERTSAAAAASQEAKAAAAAATNTAQVLSGSSGAAAGGLSGATNTPNLAPLLILGFVALMILKR